MKDPVFVSHAAPVGRGHPVRQLYSHARLMRNAPITSAPPDRSSRGRLDAIVVPATRPASALTGIITLAAQLETLIVVLCSRQTRVDQVAERINRVMGARGIAVQVDDGYVLPDLRFETSSDSFATASGGRSSDLSVKRNIGLLLARLHGWRKIAFIDDDITVSKQNISRLTHQLDHHQITGMVCRDYPDNSVFCHARRLAQLPQDVFVTGAVLGVNCSDLPLPFFADVYNEDWFFFAEAVACRRLIKVGDACQAIYDPYAEPTRASHEEFGDLMAEGLFSVIEGLHVPVDLRRSKGFFHAIGKIATERYWSTFIDVRRRDLAEIQSRLEAFTRRGNCSDQVLAAAKSLEAADKRYAESSNDRITPTHCVDFVEALQRDIDRWNKVYQGTNTLRTTDDAFERLAIAAWEPVRLTTKKTVRSRAAGAAPCAGVPV
jgi:hypothetical protein